MQKKLLAVAVGTALAAGAFVAQADTTVYGRVHTSLDWYDVDDFGAEAAGNQFDGLNVSSNSSRVGVKGKHDLGNGLNGIWQIEFGFGADETAATNQRNTFAGLSGGWGTVLMGRHDTPYKMATGKLDPFSETVGDYNSIIGSVNGGPAQFDLRLNNVVAYLSPSWGGFTFQAAWSSYGAQQVNGGDNQDQTAWSIAGVYDQGPLFLSLAYEVHEDVATAANPNGGSGGDRDALKVGAGFTMGAFKIGGVYETTSNDILAAQERDALWVTGTYTMGKNSFSVALGKADDGEGAGVDNGASMWTVGWFNALSKQTKVYLVYADQSNDTTGVYRLGDSGHGDILTVPPNGDYSSLSAGIIVDF